MRFDRELSVAVKAAIAGGRILSSHVGRLKVSDVRQKGAADWVTRIDHLSEKAILKIIRKEFPDYSVMAEESSPNAAPQRYQWMIDPLDGTVNFIHGFPMFCVSIGLAKNGIVQVGVIYDPLRKELFTAVRGKGARLNGRKIRVAPVAALKGTLINTGFPFRANNQLDIYLKSFRAVFMETGAVRRAGSAALDLAYTACGRAGGFWEMSLSPWDMAAGALLVEEAGGKVTNFYGKSTYLSDGHVAAGAPAVHKRLIQILAPIFKGKLAPAV